MKIIGLTGGIGSGKSTVAKWFEEKEIPVYNSDLEAKRLMNENPGIRNRLIEKFGTETYGSSGLNRAYLARLVFQNPAELKALNEIVHPFVFEDFRVWVKKQNAEFVVKEAAILFESGSYKDCDGVLSVIADEKIRIERVMQRDQISKAQVLERIKNQWADARKVELSDWVLYNNSGLDELRKEFETVYRQILMKLS